MISQAVSGILIRIGFVAAIVGLVFLEYIHIKKEAHNEGYKEAEAKYTQVIKNYEEGINKKLNSIEGLAINLTTDSKKNTILLSSDIKKIVEDQKGKTLTIIKDGECIPNQTFTDSFIAINKRANESLKGFRK